MSLAEDLTTAKRARDVSIQNGIPFLIAHLKSAGVRFVRPCAVHQNVNLPKALQYGIAKLRNAGAVRNVHGVSAKTCVLELQSCE